MSNSQRRYDLDWLRVILFAVLVPYHAAIGFVSYGHKVYGFRNDTIGPDLFELALYFSHGWRLHALFLISGMGTFYALKSRTYPQFILERCVRILLPLIVASFTWNAVFGYFQARAAGFDPTLAGYWLDWVSQPKHGHIRHLWFLENLFIYSLITIPVFWVLRKYPLRKGPGFLLAAFAILLVIEWALKPYGPVIFRKTYTVFSYFVFYVLGYVCMTQGDWFWVWLKRIRYWFLGAAITSFAIIANFLGFMVNDLSEMDLVIQGDWLNANWPFQTLWTASYTFFYVTNSCLWCGVIFAFGAQYLNKPHPMLSRLNRAVYPFYILHMPVLIAGLYFVANTPWPWLAEFIFLTLLTFVMTAVLYWPIPCFRLTRLLFGLQKTREFRK